MTVADRSPGAPPPTTHLELWLVRHARTSANAEGRLPSESDDPPQDDVGRAQAAALGRRLHAELPTIDLLVCSDARRARETASLALPGVEQRIDTRVRELRFGTLGGRRWADLDDDEQQLLGSWSTVGTRSPPGGESADDLAARLRSWVDELPRTGRVVTVAHAGSLAAVVHLLLGRATSDAGSTVALSPASVTRIHVGGELVTLDMLNDRCHLHA